MDTLLIGRGGGARRRFKRFNDEAFVRAVAESKMPVIACVGHEIDFTLVDYVADKRASTPTGALNWQPSTDEKLKRILPLHFKIWKKV